MEDKITIIVPLYNSEKYMKRCVDSIINQTYKNLEIILINDGSTDRTENILREYEKSDKRIIAISKKNSGVSNSRNIGIEMATGKYVMFVDSDDWMEIEAIEQLHNEMIKHPKYSIIRGKYMLNFSKGTTNNKKEKFAFNTSNKRNNIERLIDEILFGNMNCYMWILLMQTDIIKNKIRFDEKINMMEDTIFYIDLLLNENDIWFFDKIVYHYYFNEQSASRNVKNCLRNYHDTVQVHNLIKDRLHKKKLLTNERNLILSARTSRIIAEIVNNVYKYDNVNFKGIYSEIIENREVNNIMQECKKRYINIQNYFIIVFIRKKKYKLLRNFLLIRSKLARLKKLIKYGKK